MSYYLFSPIGSSDPVRNGYDGAFIHICRKYKPEKIILFFSNEMLFYHKRDNRYLESVELLKKEPGFENWNPDIECKEHDDLIEVQKMDCYIDSFSEIIKELEDICSDGDTVLLNISSGTPAMKSTLQLLSTRNRKLLKPIQVDTPLRKCNNDIDEYHIEETWICNNDNDPEKYQDRCTDSENDNLFLYLQKENIRALIKNYDYFGALTIAKQISDDLSKAFLDLLEGAKNRLALDYLTANQCFKKNGFKLLYNETGNISKIFEYILWLNIKIKTNNYIEFSRGITPVFEELLFYLVEKKVSSCVCDDGKKAKWDVKKLKESDEFKNINFVKELPDIYPTSYIKSENLIELVKEYFGNDSELLNRIDRIREFESGTRNIVAHEIQAISANKVMQCDRVFEDLKFLMTKARIINGNNMKSFLAGYDEMNDFLLSKMN